MPSHPQSSAVRNTPNNQARRNATPYPPTPTPPGTGLPSTSMVSGSLRTKYNANAHLRDDPRFIVFKDILSTSADILTFKPNKKIPQGDTLTPIP